MASLTTSVTEATEANADFLALVQLGQGVKARLSSPLNVDPLRSAVNLLAVSSTLGILFAATSTGFNLISLPDLRTRLTEAPKNNVPEIEPLVSVDSLHNARFGSVTFLRLADGESKLVAGFAKGSLACWDVLKLKAGQLEPSWILDAPSLPYGLIDVVPNPADRPELCVALYAERGADGRDGRSGQAIMLDVRQGAWGAQLNAGEATLSICWSVRGKQLALGLADGTIAQLTPEGEVKDRLPAPSDLPIGHGVIAIAWLENHVFLTTYNAPPSGEEAAPHVETCYMLTRDPKAKTLAFVGFPIDPAPAFGDTSRTSQRYLAWLKAWPPAKHLLFIAAAPSTDVGLLAYREDKGGWHNAELDETSRLVLPISSVDGSSDTAPVGLEVDLGAEKRVYDPLAAARGEEGKDALPPVPILLCYTTDGVLLAYHVINTQQPAYPGMQKEGAASSAAPTPAAPTSVPSAFATQQPAAAVAAPVVSAFGSAPSSSAFGAPSQQPSAFGAPSQPSAFGTTSAFSTTAPASAFGAPSAFGAAAATPSAFGGGAPTPAFGSTSAFGQVAFGSGANAFKAAPSAGFGFGGAPSTPAPTAASSPAPSPAPIEAKSEPAAAVEEDAPPRMPDFGKAAPPAFGGVKVASTSGASFNFAGTSSSSSATPGSTAASAFGAPSAFGSAAAQPSAFGGGAAVSAFGAPSAFGSLSQSQTTTAFGKPSFGTTSAFGNAPASTSAAAATATRSSPEESKATEMETTTSAFSAFSKPKSAFGATPAQGGSVFGAPVDVKSNVFASSSSSASAGKVGDGEGGKTKFETSGFRTTRDEFGDEFEEKMEARRKEDEALEAEEAKRLLSEERGETSSGAGDTFGLGGLDSALGGAQKGKQAVEKESKPAFSFVPANAAKAKEEPTFQFGPAAAAAAAAASTSAFGAAPAAPNAFAPAANAFAPSSAPVTSAFGGTSAFNHKFGSFGASTPAAAPAASTSAPPPSAAASEAEVKQGSASSTALSPDEMQELPEYQGKLSDWAIPLPPDSDEEDSPKIEEVVDEDEKGKRSATSAMVPTTPPRQSAFPPAPVVSAFPPRTSAFPPSTSGSGSGSAAPKHQAHLTGDEMEESPELPVHQGTKAEWAIPPPDTPSDDDDEWTREVDEDDGYNNEVFSDQEEEDDEDGEEEQEEDGEGDGATSPLLMSHLDEREREALAALLRQDALDETSKLELEKKEVAPASIDEEAPSGDKEAPTSGDKEAPTSAEKEAPAPAATADASTEKVASTKPAAEPEPADKVVDPEPKSAEPEAEAEKIKETTTPESASSPAKSSEPAKAEPASAEKVVESAKPEPAPAQEEKEVKVDEKASGDAAAKQSVDVPAAAAAAVETTPESKAESKDEPQLADRKSEVEVEPKVEAKSKEASKPVALKEPIVAEPEKAKPFAQPSPALNDKTPTLVSFDKTPTLADKDKTPTLASSSSPAAAAPPSKSPAVPYLGGFNQHRAPRSSSPLTSEPVNRADFSPSPDKARAQRLAPVPYGTPIDQPNFTGFDSPPPPPPKQNVPFSSFASGAKPVAAPSTPTGPPPGLRGAQMPSFGAPTVPSFSPAPSKLPPPVMPARRGSNAQEKVSQSPFATRQAPQLAASVSALQPGEIKETGMAGEFLRTYLTIEKELKVLHQNVARCAAFQAELREASERPESTSDFADQAIWTFGDLDTMIKLAADLQGDVNAFEERTLAQRRKMTEVQSQLLKAEVKREEAARFIRARSDADFAKLVRVRQLGPEHAENQTKLRKATQTTREGLAELEEHIAVLKRRVQDDKLGKTQRMKAPTLDSMRRTVRNISLMTAARKSELDLLTQEFEMTLNGRAESEFNGSMFGRRSVSRGPDGLDMSLLNASLPSVSPAANRSAVGAAARAAVASQRYADDFQAAFLSAVQEPLLNNESVSPAGAGRRAAYSASDLDIAFARGPAHIEAPAIAAAFAKSAAPPSKPASKSASPWQQQPQRPPQGSPTPWPQQPQAQAQASLPSFSVQAPSFMPPAAPQPQQKQPPPQQQSFDLSVAAPLPASLFALPPEPAPFAPGSRATTGPGVNLRAPVKENKRQKAPSLTRTSAKPAASKTNFSFGPAPVFKAIAGPEAEAAEESTSPSTSPKALPAPAVAISNFFSRPAGSEPMPVLSGFASKPGKPNFFAGFQKPAPPTASPPASDTASSDTQKASPSFNFAPTPKSTSSFSFSPAPSPKVAALATEEGEEGTRTPKPKPALAPSAFSNAAQQDEEEEEDEDGEWEEGDETRGDEDAEGEDDDSEEVSFNTEEGKDERGASEEATSEEGLSQVDEESEVDD